MKVFKIDNTNGMLLNQLNGKQNGTVLFFHPQCSHCTALKPQWEEMKQKLKSKKNCNIYEVNGEHMDSIHHPMKNTINGFPSILNVNNGKLSQFEKERNTQNMIQFVLSNLNSISQKNKLNASNQLKKRKVSFFLNKNKNLMKERRVLESDNIEDSIQLAKNRKKTTKKGKKGKRKTAKKGENKKTGKKDTKKRTKKYKKRGIIKN